VALVGELHGLDFTAFPTAQAADAANRW